MIMEGETKSTIFAMPSLRMPNLILFGNGSIEEIGTEAKKLNGKRSIIITDRNLVKMGLVETPKKALEGENIRVDLFEEVEFEPTVGVVEKASNIVREKHYDIVTGFGGGSALDAAKVVACLAKNEGGVRDYIGKDKIQKRGLPLILVPTTGGTGSEVSPNTVITDEADGNKKLISDSKLFPDISLVDPLLTLTVPAKLTAYVGMDALCHAMGCYISKKATPLSDALAIEAIDLIGNNLRRAVLKGETDREARYKMSLGATIGMIARVNSGGGAVHGLSYPLGTKYHFPHSQSIALLMPYVMEFNMVSAIPKFARIAKSMGEKTAGLSEKEAADKAVTAIKTLMKDIGIFQPLREFGVKKEDFPEFAETVYQYSYRHIEVNPRMLTREDIVTIYENAW
jgi:alcohol dehydrogenase class IV